MFVAVFGKKGYGKTYFVKSRLGGIKRRVIIDPNGEYEDGKVINSYRVRDYQSFLFIAEVFKKERFEIICTSKTDEDDGKVFRAVYELGNVTLIVDEAHLYEDDLFFSQIVRRGRHRAINLIAISHSAFDVLRVHRSLFDVVICFRIDEPYELSYIKRINSNVNGLESLEVGKYKVIKGEIPKWLSVQNAAQEDFMS